MFIFLLTLLVIAAGVALTVLIPKDGLGSRPAPRSHLDSFPPSRLV
jgi:hypothetical protein